MRNLEKDKIPKIFTELIKNSKHNYPTKFSKGDIPQSYYL